MRRINIHLDDEQLKRLKALSDRKGVSKAELIRRAIETYLAAEEKRRAK